MLDELNPISDFKSSTVYHVLMAFQNSNDAYTFDVSPSIGKIGTIVNTGCGTGIVVLNESIDSTLSLVNATSTWDFFSAINFRTSSYVGTMTIVDRSAFFFTEILKKYTDKLNMSIHHLTFAWVPIFVGKTKDDVAETIYVKPLYFHVTNFVQDITAYDGRMYELDFVSCYNTHGLSPQFSLLTQTTLNHKDSNTNNTMPQAYSPSSGLKSTSDEDKDKLSSRKSRLNKTKYMKTVKDFCDSLELSMNNQTSNHKKQLQTFMSMIQNDYTDKLTKVNNSDPLPLAYKFKTDEYYSNKTLDNRNLPFEQFEINENIAGISSITLPNNNSIIGAITQAMKMSRDICKDHLKKPATTFKITTSTNKECDGKYHVYTKINKYTSPYNTLNGINTGPGNGLVSKQIAFTYQDVKAMDTTVMGISYSTNPEFVLKPVEIVSNDQDTGAVYADRELLTYNRVSGSLDFFNNPFSGLNVSRGARIDNGLQNSEDAAAITAFSYSQKTTYVIDVVGNPHLLSDINRNPLDVINDKPGKANIYKFVEYEPMYVKLKIYISGRGHSAVVVNQPTNDTNVFYYESDLHLYRIINVFTPGSFTQSLECSRTMEKL